MDMPNKTDDSKQPGGSDPVSPPASGPSLPTDDKSTTDTTVPPVKAPTTDPMPTDTTVPPATSPPTTTPDPSTTGGEGDDNSKKTV